MQQQRVTQQQRKPSGLPTLPTTQPLSLLDTHELQQLLQASMIFHLSTLPGLDGKLPRKIFGFIAELFCYTCAPGVDSVELEIVVECCSKKLFAPALFDL